MSPLLGSFGALTARAFGFGTLTSAPYIAEGSVYEIAKYTVPSGGVATVTLNVPSGYRHLKIYSSTRATQAAGGTDIRISFNGDSSANYSWHHLFGSTTSATASGGSSASYIRNMNNVDGSYTNIFSGAVYDILDYASTTKVKTLKCLTGFDANGDGNIKFLSGTWYNTSSPITSIDFTTPSTTFSQNTTFTLIGIK